MAYPDPAMDEEAGETPPATGDFESALAEAFPDADWSPDRVAAFKEAIRICYEQEEGAHGGPEGPPPPGGGGKGLALIFGAPKKK